MHISLDFFITPGGAEQPWLWIPASPSLPQIFKRMTSFSQEGNVALPEDAEGVSGWAAGAAAGFQLNRILTLGTGAGEQKEEQWMVI